MDVGQHPAVGEDHVAEEFAEFLVVPEGELEVARGDAAFLVCAGWSAEKSKARVGSRKKCFREKRVKSMERRSIWLGREGKMEEDEGEKDEAGQTQRSSIAYDRRQVRMGMRDTLGGEGRQMKETMKDTPRTVMSRVPRQFTDLRNQILEHRR